MRHDLAALDADALALMANRGLVKRAAKLIAKGQGPTLAEDLGVVTGTFPDGIAVTWPEDTDILSALCTCGASTVCRHRIAVALAYTAPETAALPESHWTPASISDDALCERYGKRILTQAKRWLRSPLTIAIHPGDKPTIELPSATVRFLVPGSLEHVHTTATAKDEGVLVVLAVWACRRATDADTVSHVTLGSDTTHDLTGLDAVAPVVSTCLNNGFASLPGTARVQLASAKRATEHFVWLGSALDELDEQISAWKTRSVAYAPERAAALIGEVAARCRAARVLDHDGELLGAGVIPDTSVELANLMGLGVHARTVGHTTHVDTFLADRRSNTVLVARTQITDPEFDALDRIRIGGLWIRNLSAGEVMTRGLKRRASREIRLAAQRGTVRHDVRAQQSRPEVLRSPIVVTDLDRLRSERATQRPPWLRARVLAEDVHAFPIDSVEHVRWSGMNEALTAEVLVGGKPLQLVLHQDPRCPGAVAALERALLDAPTWVAGPTTTELGPLTCTPTAIWTATGPVVPALAGPAAITSSPGRLASTDRVTEALLGAHRALSDLAHTGVRTTPKLTDAAEQLRQVGLLGVAGHVAAVSSPETWLTAWWAVQLGRHRR